MQAVRVGLEARAVRAAQTLWLVRGQEPRGTPLDGVGALFLGIALAALGLGATVDYVGLGIVPPTPALGSLIRDGMSILRANMAAVMAPTIALAAVGLALYLAADALIGYFAEKGVLTRMDE